MGKRKHEEAVLQLPADGGGVAVKQSKKRKSDVKHGDTLSDVDQVSKQEKALKKAEKKEKKAQKSAKKAARLVAAHDYTSGSDEEEEPSKSSVKAENSLYVEDATLANLPNQEVEEFLQKYFITIEDPLSTRLRPIVAFKHLSHAKNNPHFKNFTIPTPVQAAAWPSLLAGRDVIGVAETGSGKTLAFGLPCIRHVVAHSNGKGKNDVRAVIVSPTRELACQIQEQLTALAIQSGVKVVCVYGGVPKEVQRLQLQTAQIIVATPGRLNDFLQDSPRLLANVGYAVLDEADRMLDKGFEEAIRTILSAIPTAQRQTAMFTATWPQSIRELAGTFMKTPVRISIGDNPSGDLRANTRVKQVIEVTEPYVKERRLIELLKKHQSGQNRNDRILVFCLYKKEATRIENFIRMKGFNVGGIHGDLAQAQRTQSLEAFKNGSVPCLVATDVAARGLDIPDVELVINLTYPLTTEDYVHRIGRTGRAGKEGLAITLFTDHEKGLAGGLINVLKAANQDVPSELLKFGTTVKKKKHDMYGDFYRESDGPPQKATKITFD